MSELSELDDAINALNDLWPLLEGPERQSILRMRDDLNLQASALAHKMLVRDVPQLDDAITRLNLATLAAHDAKNSIDQVGVEVNKVADTVDRTTAAAEAVAKLIAVL